MFLRLLLAIAVAPLVVKSQAPPVNFEGTPAPVSDKVPWLTQHAVAVRSIDPHDRDYSDLQPLKQAIGKARIVSLGGLLPDDATMNARQRLVRFLHEEMGFDLLASAAPLFDGEVLDRALDSASPLPANLRQDLALFLGPAKSSSGIAETSDFLDYARATRQTGRPLHMAGYGLASSPYHQKEYARQLFQFLDSVDSQLASADDRRAIESLLHWHSRRGSGITGKRWQATVPAGVDAIARVSGKLGQLPATAPNAREILWYRRTLEYLSLWSSHLVDQASQPAPPNGVVWLAKVWAPDSKIVIWSNNLSIVRNLQAQRTVGSGMAEEFGHDAYAIALEEIAAEPVPDTLEALLHATGKPYTFVDLRSLPTSHWLRDPIAARLLGTTEVSVWSVNFDAVFCLGPPVAKGRK